MQVFPQFRETQKCRLQIRAAQPEWGFAPVLDREPRTKLLLGNISSGIIIGESHVLQVPRFGLRPVISTPGYVTHDDVVVLVLLQHLYVVECLVAETKVLDKPRPQVGSIAKNLALNIARGTRPRFCKKRLARQVC